MCFGSLDDGDPVSLHGMIVDHTAHAMSDFDQIEPDDIQLAWPYHGCGVFNIEGGIRGLGIVRMVRFDINLQKVSVKALLMPATLITI